MCNILPFNKQISDPNSKIAYFCGGPKVKCHGTMYLRVIVQFQGFICILYMSLYKSMS